MKVTVNFGVVRVIVPCGSGDLEVRQLMELAITRYKKATGRDVDITIHNLKILSDGGILDPDDKLNDVADDREQIIAAFEETPLPYLSHNEGDGTSASSVGTESPDFFQNQDLIQLHPEKFYFNGSDIESTPSKGSTGILPLHVRRGSEPALNQLSPLHSSCLPVDSPKRWSAAIMVDGDCFKSFNHDADNSEQSEPELPPGEREDGSGEEKSSPTYDTRKEPLGGPLTSPMFNGKNHCQNQEVVRLKTGDGPLGIHVVPSFDDHGKEFGLIIQGIEPGGRIDRDGRFSVGDKITEVNGLMLTQQCFQSAQEIFKDALLAPEISLSCSRNLATPLPILPMKQPMPPPPVFPKPFFKPDIVDSSDGLTEDERAPSLAKSKILTPTKKILGYVKSPSSAHSSLRKIGRRILIHLTKGSVGLGFSISSKEPGSLLYIKNILPTGAAVEDGRLKIGDRILEVNRIDVSNKSQAEVVELLRQTPFGESVELVVSRPEADNSPSPHLPRQMPPEKAGDGIVPWKKREVFTFDIPLNDTGSAGLGVSVKGKTSPTPKGTIDMGIFVKSVIHGGAASKDGRLQPNDQLLNINGISLLTATNSQAMETLRRAVIQGEGPNAITLTVARRIPSLDMGEANENTDGSFHEKSDSMLSESGESFYVSNENLLSPSNKMKGLTPDTSTSDHSGKTVIHMSQSHLTTADDSTNFDAHNATQQSDFCADESMTASHSIMEQLTGFVWQGAPKSRSYSDSGVQNKNLGKVQQKLTLIDVSPTEHYMFASPKRPGMGTASFQSRNGDNFFHQKSSSCSTDMSCPLPLPPKTFKAHSRRHRKDDDGFLRNGFGRQSMPEKELCTLSAQNQTSVRTNGYVFRPPLAKNSVSSSSEHIPREMEVDVQPIAAYSKVMPKKHRDPRAARVHKEESRQNLHNSADSLSSHRSRSCHQGDPIKSSHKAVEKVQRMPILFYPACCWSCHSPGCPYHAVPGHDNNSINTTAAFVGPTLGLCKSSSLESLQTMVHQIQKMDPSGRGCNESFRAAVDRSYEAPSGQNTDMVFGSVEHEQCNGGGLLHRPCAPQSRIRSSTVGHIEDDSKKNKSGKKKGLFKGLGSVFRFGKSSKKNESGSSSSKKGEKQQEQERLEARKAAEEERDRIQQHYLKLVQQQQKMNDIEAAFAAQQAKENSQSAKPNLINGANPVPSASSQHSSSRQNKMHLLRAEHQRRHQQRQGYYPQEAREELYEQQIKKAVDKKDMCQRPLPPIPHQSSSVSNGHCQEIDQEPCNGNKSYEIYKEMSKPGSRKGFVDPDRYSHYMNFQEIQYQLQRCQEPAYPNDPTFLELMMKTQNEALSTQMKSARHYRHTLNAPRSRPISNFLDYESIYDMHEPPKLRSGAKSLPRQSFCSTRQRLPIPEYMMASKALTENSQYSMPMKRAGSQGKNKVKTDSTSNV